MLVTYCTIHNIYSIIFKDNKGVYGMNTYVTLGNKFMRIAYEKAKALYNTTKWNLKTTPIAVIVKDEKVIAIGIANDGKHVLHRKCDRLGASGTPYENCKWCTNEEHAEIKALGKCKGQDIKNAVLYLYGHYRLCESCTKALKDKGITDFVFLENAEVLFDRHNPNTVLGTEKQFEF